MTGGAKTVAVVDESNRISGSSGGPGATLKRLRMRLGRRPLVRFLLGRLGATVLLTLGTTLIVFLLTHLVPGDPVAANLGDRAMSDPELVAAFRAKNHLDESLPVQYLMYLQGLTQGDFGTSQQSQMSVASELRRYVPASAELALLAITIGLVVGVLLGVLSALRRNRLTDQVVRIVSLMGVSVPTFWLALLVFYLLFFKAGLLPAGGRLSPGLSSPPQVTGLFTIDATLAGQWGVAGDAFSHMVMPALVLSAYPVGLLTRYTRAAVLEVLDQDYVRTARAKGMPARVIIVRHVLRAASASIITVIALAFGALLSGTVLVESIFSWPGLGQYAYSSALALDLPAITGVSLVIALIYVVVNLLTDIAYGLIDPRMRLS